MIALLSVEVGKKFAGGSVVGMVLVLLLCLTVLSPARAGSINPLDKKALPIPGDIGMEYFYGEWMPWGDASALVFQSITFHRDGHITRDWWVPEDRANDPPELFKLVAWDKKTVLLATKFWNQIHNKFDYSFWSLTLLKPDNNAKIPDLLLGDCDYIDPPFGETEWQMSPEKIFTFFKKSRSCNPSLNQASKKYPWEGWSKGYYSLLSR